VNLYAFKFPSRRYDRLHCGHVFGDSLCRANLALPGMQQTCGVRWPSARLWGRSS